MARILGRLGRFCTRNRRWVFALWAVLAICVGAAGLMHGGTFVQQDRLPGTETQRAIDLMRNDFSQVTGPTATVVLTPQKGFSLQDWRVRLQAGKAIYNLGKLPRASLVENPYLHTGGALGKNAVVAVVHLKGTARDVSGRDLAQLQEATEPAREAGLDVRFGGLVSFILNQPKAGPGEGLGIVLAGAVLLLAFGSWLAAAVPVVVALSVMAVAYPAIIFGASLTQVHPATLLVAAMLGLGAGIDYALFVVTRHRQQLDAGMDVESSVERALATSGHAVVFAGGTVVFAICGLWLSGITFVGIIGVASAVTVSLMVAGALTLLPAVLGAIGTRIDRYRLPFARKTPGTMWNRWGGHVDRHAWPYAIGATLVLLTLALPVLTLRFGIMSDSTLPRSNSARQAYDITAREFGPGWYSPFVVAATVPAPPKPKPKPNPTPKATPKPKGSAKPKPPAKTQPTVLHRANPEATALGNALAKRLAGARGVAAVEPPVVSGNTVLVEIVPAGAPQAKETADLVERLRTTAIPPVVRDFKGAQAHLGGETPAIIDLAGVVKARMLYVVAAVVGVAILLLVIAFRSVLVPLKAALMNLLSIGASYGIVVAVFQWGWGIHLLGLDQPIPIVAFVPLFMFASLFGLSMDYEVFLLSRIKEEYLRTNDPHGSVVTGIGSTARLITSAAMIMISVSLSFLPQPDTIVKMMALGIATAVAVDVTIVRLVLVPALMSLLGHANWWWPGRRRSGGVAEAPDLRGTEQMARSR